jgi:hypothetical protein
LLYESIYQGVVLCGVRGEGDRDERRGKMSREKQRRAEKSR